MWTMLIKLLRIHGRHMYFSFRISSNSLKRTTFFFSLVRCLLSSFVCQLDATNNHKISTTASKLCVVQSTRKKRCWNLCNNLWQSLNVIPRKLITFDVIFLWTKLCLFVCLFFPVTSSKENLHTKTSLPDSAHIQAQNAVYIVQGRMAIGVYNFRFCVMSAHWKLLPFVYWCCVRFLLVRLLLLLPFEFQDFGHRLIRAQAI